jgi:mycothiol synthase
MSNLPCIIRNYHSEDFDKLVRLGTDVAERGQTGCPISPLDLIESLGQPDHPSEHNLFIAERAGEIIGYAQVSPELHIGRAVLGWLVHPRHRRRRIAAKLINLSISRTRELGIKTIQVNIRQNSPTARRLLTRVGFTLIRRYLELSLDLSRGLLPETGTICPGCRPLRPGEEGRLAQLQNRSFTGSWGYNANTVEGIMHRIHLPHCSPEDIILAFDADKPIGYCWTRISFWKNDTPGAGAGRIYMLGVDPDYRGRGVGRQLLLVGLSHLKRKGLRSVELTVDKENKAACVLYQSAGFKLLTRSLWYEKRLD